jgi:EAL domain-containing protein (putative c-di-GMP-specific phosphodiesterase class I)
MSARPSPPIAEDMKSVTVLIADDEPLVRDFLAETVQGHPVFEVVGVAADADEAIGLAEGSLPDVALVDVKMPGGGPRATRGILECSPRTRVVALSAHGDRAIVLDMLRAGAVSYVVKGGEIEEVIETLLRSARGESILSAEVSSGVIEELASHLERRHLEEREQGQLLERIRRVVYEGFELAFQPIVDLRESRTIGVEALSRFSGEPTQSPDLWFADAERVGLRAELELAAARAAVARLEHVEEGVFLSLNLSPETLPSFGDLADEVGPGRLVVEITEHAAIEDYDAVGEHLARLRERGARVAVDDAGAGFASLRHALQLSPDFIKLDVSLTHGIDNDRRRHALAAGLIGFADELGAAVVAEGIETRAELDTLRELGVQFGQGYFLSAPGPLPLEKTQLSHLARFR